MPEGDVQRRTGEVGGRPGLIPVDERGRQFLRGVEVGVVDRGGIDVPGSRAVPAQQRGRPFAGLARAVSGPWFAATSVSGSAASSPMNARAAVGQGTPVALDPLRRAKRPRESLDPPCALRSGTRSESPESSGSSESVRLPGSAERAITSRRVTSRSPVRGRVARPAARRGRRRPREDPPPRRRRARTRTRTRRRRPRSSLGGHPVDARRGEIFIVPIIPDARPHQRDEQGETAETGCSSRSAPPSPRRARSKARPIPVSPSAASSSPSRARPPARRNASNRRSSRSRCRSTLPGFGVPPPSRRSARVASSTGSVSRLRLREGGRLALLRQFSPPPRRYRVGDPGERRGRSLGRPTLTASAPYAAYSATVSRPPRRC